MAIGRISGPLLKANLLRDGVDLAFETDLLYLDVSDPDPANHRVGIKNSSPTCTLDIIGSVCATELRGEYLLVDDVEIDGNTIRSTVGNLILEGATGSDSVQIESVNINGNTISAQNPGENLILGTVEIPNISGNVDIQGNIFAFNLNTENIALQGQTFVVANILIDGDGDDSAIRTLNSNTNLTLDPSGTGIIILNATTQVNGDLNVTGNITGGANLDIVGDITFGGSINLGNQDTDTISIDAEFTSDLIPDEDNKFTIGSSTKAWNALWVGNLKIDSTLIATTDSNADLEFRPAGIGKVYANANLMEVAGDFTAQAIVDTIIDCGEY